MEFRRSFWIQVFVLQYFIFHRFLKCHGWGILVYCQFDRKPKSKDFIITEIPHVLNTWRIHDFICKGVYISPDTVRMFITFIFTTFIGFDAIVATSHAAKLATTCVHSPSMMGLRCWRIVSFAWSYIARCGAITIITQFTVSDNPPDHALNLDFHLYKTQISSCETKSDLSLPTKTSELEENLLHFQLLILDIDFHHFPLQLLCQNPFPTAQITQNKNSISLRLNLKNNSSKRNLGLRSLQGEGMDEMEGMTWRRRWWCVKGPRFSAAQRTAV